MAVLSSRALWVILAVAVALVVILLAVMYGGADGGGPTAPGGY